MLFGPYPMEDPQRYRHTVGGLPSGYLSQKPIHDPSCQTGDRAPQGRSDRQPGQAFCLGTSTYEIANAPIDRAVFIGCRDHSRYIEGYKFIGVTHISV